MKVFISWSGTTSHQVAQAFHGWLRHVIQTIKPFISSEDIEKGVAWFPEIVNEIEDSSIGIVCVTPENQTAPWLLFETGAMSKALKAPVCPFLFGLGKGQLQGPLSQFNQTEYEEQDIFHLVQSINKANKGEALENSILKEAFYTYWPQWDKKLQEIEQEAKGKKGLHDTAQRREAIDIMEEVLQLVRNQWRYIKTPERLLPARYLKKVMPGKSTYRVLDDSRLSGSWKRPILGPIGSMSHRTGYEDDDEG